MSKVGFVFPCLLAKFLPLVIVSIALLTGLSASAADEPPEGAGEQPDEVSLSLDEAHHVELVPNIGPTRLGLDYSGPLGAPGHTQAGGVQFGARLLSSSNRSRSILIGLDLTQILAQSQGASGLNFLGTKLGIRAEYHPPLPLDPAIGLSWFFGDTIVDHQRDIQYNGNTGSLFASVGLGRVRWFFEWGFGTYYQGGGFIILSHTPGADQVAFSEYATGVEFPIDLLWPSWATMKPLGPSPAPR